MTWLLFAQFAFIGLLVADTLKAGLGHRERTDPAKQLFEAMAADSLDAKHKKVEEWRSLFKISHTLVAPVIGLLWFALLVAAGCDTQWSLAWAAFYAAQVTWNSWRYRTNELAVNATHDLRRTAVINAIETALLWKAGLFFGLLPW